MVNMVSRRQFMGGAAAAALSGCVAPMGHRNSYFSQILAPQNNNAVFHWLDVILQQTRDQRVAPPRAAYNFAMPLVAGFLAVNGITRTYAEPYRIGFGPTGADLNAAYAAAFATCASEVFQQPFLVERNSYFEGIPDGVAKSRGAKWGRHVGMQIVKMRTNDGAEPSKVNYYLGRYQQREDVLGWTPTGPFYGAKPGPAFDTYSRALFPGHGQIKPWTMVSGSQFRAPNFYHPASPEFAKEFDLVRRLGGAKSYHRTADQAEIALFWEDGPWGVTPPGHFLYLAAQILQHNPVPLVERARQFALLGMTQCDASISAWDSKYAHDILRPETAIRSRASKMGNPDPRVRKYRGWQSFIPTPEFPAYTSGHSTFGAAGAEMIRAFHGSDRINLSGQSPDQVLWPQLRGVRRHWTSLSQIEEENGLSRIYGGVHWMADHIEATRSGHAIARHALANLFPSY